MALTINSTSESHQAVKAPAKMKVFNFDADASYPAGGYPVTAAQRDHLTVRWSETVGDYDGSAKRHFRYDRSTDTIKCFADTNDVPGAEVSGSTDLSGHTGVELAVFGD